MGFVKLTKSMIQLIILLYLFHCWNAKTYDFLELCQSATTMNDWQIKSDVFVELKEYPESISCKVDMKINTTSKFAIHFLRLNLPHSETVCWDYLLVELPSQSSFPLCRLDKLPPPDIIHGSSSVRIYLISNCSSDECYRWRSENKGFAFIVLLLDDNNITTNPIADKNRFVELGIYGGIITVVIILVLIIGCCYQSRDSQEDEPERRNTNLGIRTETGSGNVPRQTRNRNLVFVRNLPTVRTRPVNSPNRSGHQRSYSGTIDPRAFSENRPPCYECVINGIMEHCQHTVAK